MELNKENRKRALPDSLLQQSKWQLLDSNLPTGGFAPMDIDKENKKCPSSESFLQWSQWQLLDSILPTGGFAHSFGLEAAIQARIVTGPEDPKTFVIHLLENTGSLLLPFVYSTTISPDLETRWKLDKMLDAMLTNEVGRKASITQGSALMRVAAVVYSEIPSLKYMREASLSSGVASFHHAPIFGLICGLLGLDSSTSQRAYMFITMRDVISSATRLNLVGPLGAAVLQHQIAPVAESILNQWKDRSVEEACQTLPCLTLCRVVMATYFLDCSVLEVPNKCINWWSMLELFILLRKRKTSSYRKHWMNYTVGSVGFGGLLIPWCAIYLKKRQHKFYVFKHI